MKTACLFAALFLALSVSATTTFQSGRHRRGQVHLNVGQGNNDLKGNDAIGLEQLERNGGINVVLLLTC